MDYKIHGELDIEILDSSTFEVKRSQNETNDFTRQGNYFLNIMNGIIGNKDYTAYWENADNWSDFDTSTGFYSIGGNALYISPMKFAPHSTCVRYLVGAIGHSTVINAGTYSHSLNTGTITWKFRFNPPTSTRTVWSVSLIDNGNSSITLSPLSNACTQTPTEILDVTYRVQINYGTTPKATGNAVCISDVYSRGHAYANIARNDAKTIYTYQFMPHKCHRQSMNYRGWGVLPGYDGGWIRTVPETASVFYKGRMSLSWGINDGHGRLIQSLYTKNRTGARNNSWNYSDQQGVLFDKFGGSFANKPIQPVFLHSATSTIPFMDINNVGSSTGSLTINGTNWVEPPMPEYYRLDITKSGSANNAAYYFRKRILTGFNGNSYFPNPWHDSFTCRMTGSWGGFGEFENTTLVGMHGSSKEMPTNWEEYTAYKFVLFDDTGISIIDITNGDGVNFDATTTPALPVLKVQQVAVNFSNGDVWVACPLTGLYRIQNPFNNPTVTKIPTIGGITGVNKAYAVAVGYNNSIWCVIDGALAKSTDNGLAWTVQSFTYVGISDSLWSRVKQIRTDINSSTNNLAIVYGTSDSTNPVLSICWWSDSIGAVAGPTSVGPVPASLAYIPFNRYWVVRCSHYGSMWVVALGDSARGYTTWLKSYKFGTTTVLQNFSPIDDVYYSGSSIKNLNISFYYDYYNVPHVVGIQKTYPAFNFNNLFDIRGNVKSLIRANFSFDEFSGYSSDVTIRQSIVGSFGFNASYNKSPLVHTCFQREDGGGVGLTSARVGHFYPIFPISNYSYSGYNTTGGYAHDDLNGKYSVTSEMLWKKYHWNPNTNQWQHNYYAPAVDSSSLNINSIRHNFDTESHYFTGRSLIDITQNISNAAINGNATFAFTVKSNGKLTSVNQEVVSTLLSIENTNSCFRIIWTGGANFEIHHGTGANVTVSNIAAALTNDVVYRIVVVIAGTQCMVYSNGVQLGSTLTMSTSFDFSLSDSSLKSYVGAQCYYRNFSTTTPMPYGFFRGNLSNVQIWNTSWDAADVTNDNSAPTSVITSKPAANLKMRLQLTEPLVETKTTHTASDVLDNGITLKFNNNTVDPNTSLFATDYYTFGVVDGILKDNATSFAHQLDVYGSYAKVNVNHNEFTNIDGTNTIKLISSPFTMPVHWKPNIFPYQSITGQCGLTATTATGSYPWRCNMGMESIIGDGEFTFYLMCERSVNLVCGFTHDATWYETTNSALVWPRLKYVFRFASTTAGEIREGSSTAKTGSAFTFAFGDKFTIKRTGTTIQYLVNDVVINTTTGTVTTPLTPVIYCDQDNTDNNSRGVINCTVTINPNRPMMFVGNMANNTGCFNRKFLGVDWSPISSIKLSIDGNSAPVTVADISYGFLHNTPAPVQGQITLMPWSGILLFNDADINKTISGTCIAISDV